MTHNPSLARLLGALALLSPLVGKAAPTPAAAPLTVSVDLTEASRRLIHVHQTIPVKPGATQALVYAKWLPGEHGPTGPITDYVGLRITAAGKPLAWRRDAVDMYRFLVDVPAGVGTVEVAADFLSPPPQMGGFSGSASMTPSLAVLSWNQVMLFPDAPSPRVQQARAELKLPPGWRAASALAITSSGGELVRYAPTTVEMLIDSPVLAGAHLVDVSVGDFHGAPVSLHVAADAADEARLTDGQRAFMGRLLREEMALFGHRHFDRYAFLLTLSDLVGHFGLEHHQSSDNRMPGRTLVDKELALWGLGSLLAHESVHSWNGKYRRPAGLATGDFSSPMKGELLWVYEGLTQYLGKLLTARAGHWTAQQYRDHFAITAEGMRRTIGRKTRPLLDTAVAAQLLYAARDDWGALRRSVDFYPEGDLFWLEVDVRIREATGGKASLDDVIARFWGGTKDGSPEVVPYSLDDVTRAIKAVAPTVDLPALVKERFERPTEDAPLEGLARAGWKLDYGEEPSDLFSALEKIHKVVLLGSSIGLTLKAEDATIIDVVPGMAADRAGAAPAMKLIGVNGRKFSVERLQAAIVESKRGTSIELLVENADSFRTLRLDYKDGPRYPKLVPIPGKPDLLTAIGAPRAKN